MSISDKILETITSALKVVWYTDASLVTPAAKPAKILNPKVCDIIIDIKTPELNKLINDKAVTILHMWGNGNALNVACYWEV